MTTSPDRSVGGALARRENPASQMITTYADDFASVLPTHVRPETWMRLAQGLLRRNEDLAACAARNPVSFASALMEAARLGHEPGTDRFYLIPQGSEVRGSESWKGIVSRIFNSGAVLAVIAEVVHARDRFSYKPALGAVPDHTPYDGDDDPGELVKVYAYAQLASGGLSRVVVLNKRDVHKRRAMSAGWQNPKSPWQRWEDQMWLKCAVRSLEGWVPTSTERLPPLPVVQASAVRLDAASGRAQLGPAMEAELLD